MELSVWHRFETLASWSTLHICHIYIYIANRDHFGDVGRIALMK